MALIKMAQGVDTFDYSLELKDEEAEKVDGNIFVEDTFPCNKIATVRWSFIDEEY